MLSENKDYVISDIFLNFAYDSGNLQAKAFAWKRACAIIRDLLEKLLQSSTKFMKKIDPKTTRKISKAVQF